MSATKTGNRIINVDVDKASPPITFHTYKKRTHFEDEQLEKYKTLTLRAPYRI